jgi:hypothetical protein
MTDSVTENADVDGTRDRYRRSRSNRSRSHHLTNEVIIYLRDAGFGLAHRRAERLRLPEAVRIAANHGDVMGIPGWTIAVRAHQNLDLSGSATEVAQEAARAGRELYVSIQPRKGHPLDEAYATMPLHVFVKVLQRLNPGAVLPTGEADLVSTLISEGGAPS